MKPETIKEIDLLFGNRNAELINMKNAANDNFIKQAIANEQGRLDALWSDFRKVAKPL